MTRWQGAGVLAVLIGLGGCGDNADSSFRPDYERLKRQVSAFSNDVARTFNRAGPAGDAGLTPRFAGLANRARMIDRRLAALRPPDSERSEVTALRASLDRLRRDLNGVLSAFRRYNPGRWVSSRTAAAKHLRSLRAAAGGR